MKKNKKLEAPDDPKIKIEPLDPGGSAVVSFNQRMVAPKNGTFLSPNLYESTFGMTSISLNDNTIFTASFIKNISRLLQEVEEESEAQKLSFKPNVIIHSDTKIKINLEFDNPDYLTVGGLASIELFIKEVSIFKSATTLKPLDMASFEKGVPKMIMEVPPIISNYEQAKSIEETAT